jgi:hypothetical protein
VSRPAFILIALLSCSVAAFADEPAPRLLHASDQVEGKRVDAFPALWWRWANHQYGGAFPYQDPTGAHCAGNQAGPVWFLAGTEGTEAVSRHCRVPTGKHIFLPVITMLESRDPDEPDSCARVKLGVRENNEHVVVTEISVDGQPFELAPLRMSSDCFNAYGRGAGGSATDGYWLMLAPLADGAHRIRVKVRYDNPGVAFGDMDQDFEYLLDVGGPEPGPEEKDPDNENGEWRRA